MTFEIFSELIEVISQKYYRRQHQLGRLRSIYRDILKLYCKKIEQIMIKGLHSRRNKQIFIDRVESIVWDYKIKLLNVFNTINSYHVLEDLDCPLSNWQYIYNDRKDDFEIIKNGICSRNCFNIEESISNFIKENEDFINKIISNYVNYSINNNIPNYDKNLINVLKRITNNLKDNKISTRECKSLGDLFIVSVLRKRDSILTKNRAHFKLLLLCKGNANSLISF